MAERSVAKRLPRQKKDLVYYPEVLILEKSL